MKRRHLNILSARRWGLWPVVALALGLALLMGAASISRAATPIYVRTDGDDVNCNGTTNDPYPGGGPGLNCAVRTVQKGIDLVDVGGTVNVAAGTYNENILINKRLALIGQGSSAAGTILAQDAAGAGDTKIGVVQLAASGLSAAQPLLLQDLRIEPDGMAGISVGRFTEATGVAVSYVKFDNVHVIGTNTNPATEQERGFYVDLTSSVYYLEITDCAFDNLTYGWYLQKQVSADTSTVQYVEVTRTTFSHNNTKGIYAEKLSDAAFTSCIVDGNGFSDLGVPSYFLPWMCGIDINLKAGTYQNLSFVGCTITDNALGGAKEGVGLTVKGRDDGTTYGPYPATVSDVTVEDCIITGNERGIRFGEPGKLNAGPTGVEVHNCTIEGNIQTYGGSDGSAYGGLVDMTASSNTIDAENNWWGATDGPAPTGSGDAVYGDVDYTPWLTSPFDVYVDAVNGDDLFGTGSASNPYATIGKGISEARSGVTVHVAAGTYNEQVIVNKSLTLSGAGSTTTHIVAPAAAGRSTYTIPESSATFDPVVIAFGGSESAGAISGAGTIAFSMSGFHVDGNDDAQASPRYAGILLRNVNPGTVSNNAVDGLAPAAGNPQTGGIMVYGDSDVTVSTNTVSSHTRIGIVANGDDGALTDPTTAIQGNTVTGLGPTGPGSWAQNGIQIGFGATGSVQGNHVSNHSWAGTGNWAASSILVSGASGSVTVSGNDVTDGQAGVYWIGTSGSIQNNTILVTAPFAVCSACAGEIDGMIVDPGPGSGVAVPASPLVENALRRESSRAPTASYTVVANDNTLTGKPTAGANDTVGIWVIAWSPDTLDFSGQGNTATGWDDGFVFYAETGATLNVHDLKNNRIYGNNLYGAYNLNSTEISLVQNWWGDASGPYHGTKNAAGTGNAVSDYIDFSPWAGVLPGASPMTWVTNDSIQEAIDLAISGDTVIVKAGTYAESVSVNKSITLVMEPGVLIQPASPCFTVSADNITLSGGVCEPTSGSHGIQTGADVNNLVIKNMEIRKGASTTGNGINLGHNVNNLRIVDNYIHSLDGNGLDYASTATVSGVHEVQGNLFQANAGYGVNNASTGTYNVEYNSWGHLGGPASGDGAHGSLDTDPWTHVALDTLSSGSPVLNKVGVGSTIKYTIRMDAAEVWGADFDLAFDKTKLQVNAITNSGSFDQNLGCTISGPAEANASGVISFCGDRTLLGSALNGTAQPLFEVVFQGIAPGIVPLDLDQSDDAFAMAPPSGASNNIYAHALTDGSVTVYDALAVTGRIDLQGRLDDTGAAMTFAAGLDQGYGPFVFSTSDSWGAISASGVVQDTYDITVSMARYLDVTAGSGKSVAISSFKTTLNTLVLLGGDADGDDVDIGITDATIIGGAYGTHPGDLEWDEDGDINADNVISILDLAILGGNYGKASATAYAGWTP